MSNEQFDHIENKIRKAAMQSEPPFNELAWNKMEKKLDEESDRKRPVFWWMLATILLISVSTGAIFMFNESGSMRRKNLDSANVESTVEKYSKAPAEQTFPQNEAGMKVSRQSQTKINFSGDRNSRENNSEKTSASVTGSAARKVRSNHGHNAFNIVMGAVGDSEDREQAAVAKISKTENTIQNANAETDNTNDELAEKPEFKSDSKNDIIDKVIEKESDLALVDSAKISPDSSSNYKNGKEEKKENKSKSSLYFVASAGPEITAVNIGKANGRNISTRFGIGIGYQFSKRIALQTGFYSVAKKYVAGKDDYNPKDATYLSQMNELVVDANCRVFEIPLSIRYNFPAKGVNTFFASSGVAGVVMKKENYKFTYTQGTYPYVGTYTDEKAFTGNRHFISFMQFSGGIARQINSSLSVLAEPYLTLPLQGVGEGRVILFSAGVQLGIKYRSSKK